MRTLLEVITTSLDDKKAQDIRVVDFRNENPLCDYFVIADAPSMRQIHALSDDVIDQVEKEGYKIKHIERQNDSSWILVDAYDVVVHIFLSEERGRYSLEKLYQDYLHENTI